MPGGVAACVGFTDSHEDPPFFVVATAVKLVGTVLVTTMARCVGVLLIDPI
jgi:hypothetical protein